MRFLKRVKLAKKYLLSPKPANGPIRQADFEMYLQNIDINDYTERLKSYDFANKIIAEMSYQNQKYPITQIDITGAYAKKKLLIFAGVHGNEFAGVLAVEDLLAKFKMNPELYDEWSIRILTPLNPIGVAYMSRYNQDGYDINRDFKHFTTLEARLQRDAITNFVPDILVTFHESLEKGFFIFSEGKLSTSLTSKITQELHDGGVVMAPKSYFGIKTKAGIWEKPPLAYALQRLINMHTLGSYVYAMKIPTLTTESNWSNKDINARKLPHILTVTAVLKNPD